MANTRADVAAGVVFHRPCKTRYHVFGDDFCTTHSYYFNDSATSHLGGVDLARADVLSQRATVSVDEKDFTSKGADYRIRYGDVVKFKALNERNRMLAEPEDSCVGFWDMRPRLLHPIGADLRIGIIGLANAGKTTLFNLLTGSDGAVSPNVFTTQRVTARSRKLADDRFEWLAKHFPQATLRPSTITFVDTPALLYPFDRVPWKDDVYERSKAATS
ncbi:GTP binding domain containing protein [Aphelenchoides avenae]|nr:GTP binding domain containing protein [Aphelenchus avenae]